LGFSSRRYQHIHTLIQALPVHPKSDVSLLELYLPLVRKPEIENKIFFLFASRTRDARYACHCKSPRVFKSGPQGLPDGVFFRELR